jgi:phosphoglycolate phosphatase
LTVDQLAALLSRTRVLLLDFDGPVCSLFAGYPAPHVAADLHRAIEARFGPIPQLVSVNGPLRTLRRCADVYSPEVTRFTADALRDFEVTAAASATPTPGAAEVLEAAGATGRPVAIVSNNSDAAVTAYLDQHELRGHVDLVVGRHDGIDPKLLKPDPYLPSRALDGMGASAPDAALIGDSTSDIEAAHAAGVTAIGYANKPGKHEAQTQAGAHAIVTAMTDLADALRRG